MSIENLKKDCISCGACKIICPVNAINIEYKRQEGFYRPQVNKEICTECGKCTEICPAKWPSNESILGEYERIVLAHSENPIVRKFATSGGVVNELIRFLIKHKVVDAAVLTRHDDTSPIETSSCIITSENISQLEETPREFASRYVSYPVLSELDKLDHDYKRVAVVGTPCQIRGLLNIRTSGKLKNVDFFLIGITCSGGMSYKASSEYKRKMKLVDSRVYYRGDGWPGKNLLILDNNTFETNHLGSVFERMYSSQIFKNHGCRFCTDHFAELADISFCDYWNRKELEFESVGNSCVIVRSSEADMLLQLMEDSNCIHVVRQLDEESVIQSQAQTLKVKKGKVRYSVRFKLYYVLCDYIFEHKVYRHFGVKTYRLLSAIYNRICMI